MLEGWTMPGTLCCFAWHLLLHKHSEVTVDGWTVLKGQPTVISNPSNATVGIRQKGFCSLCGSSLKHLKTRSLFFQCKAHSLMLMKVTHLPQSQTRCLNLPPGVLDYKEKSICSSFPFVVEQNGIMKLRQNLATFKIKLSICWHQKNTLVWEHKCKCPPSCSYFSDLSLFFTLKGK